MAVMRSVVKIKEKERIGLKKYIYFLLQKETEGHGVRTQHLLSPLP